MPNQPLQKTLLDKLGIKPDSSVAVLGVADNGFLRELSERAKEVLDGRTEESLDFIFLLAEGKEDLSRLVPLQDHIKRNGAIWVITPRGNQQIKQIDVIAAGKEAGMVDVKVVRFSETHTALKMVIPIGRR